MWCARDSSLYWVDIYGKQLHRYTPDTESGESWEFEQLITSIAPRQQGGFILTLRNGFALWDADNDCLDYLPEVEPELPDNRFNDGKVDSRGYYWAGTMDDRQENASGSLYRLDAELNCEKLDSGYIITNGPTFSPDNRTLYHTDTLQRTIYAFDVSASGELDNKRVQLRTPQAYGHPDGMTTDSEGGLWVCFFGGARVVRFSPEGSELATVELPVSNITSCAFGGEDLDTLFITTASIGLSEEEKQKQTLAGSLFACQPGVRGLAGGLFTG